MAGRIRVNNEWIKVGNDQLPDHCHFIGNEGLNMNTISCNLLLVNTVNLKSIKLTYLACYN